MNARDRVTVPSPAYSARPGNAPHLISQRRGNCIMARLPKDKIEAPVEDPAPVTVTALD